MGAGKTRKTSRLISPIVRAIADAERMCTCEFRVHVSRRWREPDAFERARALFEGYGLQRTSARNAVFFYVNLRARSFAIIADENAAKAVGNRYWEELGSMLRDDLLSTHPENAIALAVRTAGATLSRHFPPELD